MEANDPVSRSGTSPGGGVGDGVTRRPGALARLRTAVAGGPLGNRSFRLLGAGQLASTIGDLCYAVALPWLILSSHGGPVLLGAVLACYGVPRTVLIPVGGILADRLGPRLVMLIADAARCVLVAALAVLAARHTASLAVLGPLAALIGAGEGLFLPASFTIIPSIVIPEQLQAANAISTALNQVGSLLGPVLGGLLVATAGSAPAFAVDAASFAISALTRAADHAGGRRRGEPHRGRHLRGRAARPRPCQVRRGRLRGADRLHGPRRPRRHRRRRPGHGPAQAGGRHLLRVPGRGDRDLLRALPRRPARCRRRDDRRRDLQQLRQHPDHHPAAAVGAAPAARPDHEPDHARGPGQLPRLRGGGRRAHPPLRPGGLLPGRRDRADRDDPGRAHPAGDPRLRRRAGAGPRARRVTMAMLACTRARQRVRPG